MDMFVYRKYVMSTGGHMDFCRELGICIQPLARQSSMLEIAVLWIESVSGRAISCA